MPSKTPPADAAVRAAAGELPSTSSTAPPRRWGCARRIWSPDLVTKYVDPDSQQGLTALGSLSTRDGRSTSRGRRDDRVVLVPALRPARGDERRAGRPVPADRREATSSSWPSPASCRAASWARSGGSRARRWWPGCRRRSSDDADIAGYRDVAGPHRRRADPPRRARLGPVLAAAQGPHRVPRHARSTTTSPTSIIAQLLFLDSEDPDKDVMMYINSPGGEVTAGLASTTRCSSSAARSRRSAWARRRRWPASCSRPARRASASCCRTRA